MFQINSLLVILYKTVNTPARIPADQWFGDYNGMSFSWQDGITAIMQASHEGRTAIVELLLEAGADKDAKDEVRPDT